MKHRGCLIQIFIVVCLFVCYPLLIQRSFITDKTGTKNITLLKRLDGAYLIPGKYYGLLKPKENYLKFKLKNSFSIIWNPHDNLCSLIIVDSALEAYEYYDFLDKKNKFLLFDSHNERDKYLLKYYENSEVLDVNLFNYSFFFGKNSWNYN